MARNEHGTVLGAPHSLLGLSVIGGWSQLSAFPAPLPSLLLLSISCNSTSTTSIHHFHPRLHQHPPPRPQESSARAQPHLSHHFLVISFPESYFSCTFTTAGPWVRRPGPPREHLDPTAAGEKELHLQSICLARLNFRPMGLHSTGSSWFGSSCCWRLSGSRAGLLHNHWLNEIFPRLFACGSVPLAAALFLSTASTGRRCIAYLGCSPPAPL